MCGVVICTGRLHQHIVHWLLRYASRKCWQ
jgi:hypothetical protein